MRLTLSVLAVVSSVAIAALAAEPTAPHVAPHPHWHGFWWICPLMFLFMFLVCATAFTFQRRGGSRIPFPWMFHPRHEWDAGSDDSALEILSKRYAAGEIDREEYEERRSTLLSEQE